MATPLADNRRLTDARTIETNKDTRPPMGQGDVMPEILLKRLIWLVVKKHKVHEQLHKNSYLLALPLVCALLPM